MSAANAVAGLASPGKPRDWGVTLAAAVLIGSPLLWWVILSALSHFTFLEPPFTTSRGIVLAMQLFFSPGSVLAAIFGIGLILRSDRMRRWARVMFLITVGLAALQLGWQVAAWRFDVNSLLAGITIAFSGWYWWYFGRSAVRQQFAVHALAKTSRPAVASLSVEVPATAGSSRALNIGACVECCVGLAAMLLVAHLYTIFHGAPLLDLGGGDSVAAADDLLKAFLFVAVALLLAPHVLATAGSAGILLRRNTVAMTRRYVLAACWSTVGCLLLAAWLVMRPEFAFNARAAQWLVVFCSVSLVWHACFLVILARCRAQSGPR